MTSRIISPPPLIGPHRDQVLVLGVEHADAGRAVQLVAGEDVEIASMSCTSIAQMHGGLAAVDQHRDAAGVRDASPRP